MTTLTRDGRNIDPALGVLLGEGAATQVKKLDQEVPLPSPRALETVEPAVTDATYYGQPLLKETVWTWAIPAYFYLGGLAGAMGTLGACAQLVGGARLRPLVRACRWASLGGITVGTGLLVYDLGRPSRFLHMLRVFRPTSPMNLGSWVLSAAGASAGAAVLLDGKRRSLGDAAGLALGLLGLPLASYTGVLLANTAVPVWSSARRSLPPLFVASGIASAASLCDLLPLDRSARAVVEPFGIAGKLGELAGAFVLEREAGRVPRVAEPLRRGRSGLLWQAAKLATATSLALSLWPRPSRTRRIASGILGTLGTLALRFALVDAGRASARDPRATHRQQRARLAQRPPPSM